MSAVNRIHPAEKMGLWIPSGGTTASEQQSYAESDKGVLGDFLPLSVTQSHIDRGGYLRNDCALALAFTEALGYDVILVGEYLFPIGKLGFEPEYVDEALNAGRVWRRNYMIKGDLHQWNKQDCRNKEYGTFYRYDPVLPIKVELQSANLFGVWSVDILPEV